MLKSIIVGGAVATALGLATSTATGVSDDPAPPEEAELVQVGQDIGEADLTCDADDADTQAVGDRCTITDSNGPLPGGTITILGCDDGEFCMPIACAGYSCWGTCVAGGPIGK